jgi:hypothetical protein
MQTKTFFAAAGASIILGIGLGAGCAAGEFLQGIKDTRTVRVAAIANNCGQYNAKTGIFEWVRAETAADIVLSDPDISRALTPPIPQHKPKVQ